jgi:hypothetical protein
VFCFDDTALTPDGHGAVESHDEGHGARAYWIWFGAAGDSTEITVSDGSIATSLGQEHDQQGNSSPYIRRRLTADGGVTIDVSMAEYGEDSVPYTLTIRRDGPARRRGFRATSERATLNVESQRLAEFSLIPLSIASTVNNRSQWKAFAGRTHNVALVDDSLYEFCRLPCVRPDTVKLTPSAVVTRRF